METHGSLIKKSGKLRPDIQLDCVGGRPHFPCLNQTFCELFLGVFACPVATTYAVIVLGIEAVDSLVTKLHM